MTEHDGGWKPRKYPGLETAAFKITNDWAKAMLAWQERVWAMCAIMEAKLDISETAFDDVLKSIQKGVHSPEAIKRILDEDEQAGRARSTGVSLPSDVVGHPPDPPFDASL